MVCLSHCPNPSPPDFSKMAVIGEGGEWEISTRNRGGGGGGFIMGDWKFLKSLDLIGRGVITSITTPAPTFLSVVLFLWLNRWSQHIWCAILLNDNIDLHMLNLETLVPEGPWCVFYATRCQVYWGLTHVVFYWYSDVVITHTNTKAHTAHSGASRLTHPYKYIFTPPVMCSQQSE